MKKRVITGLCIACLFVGLLPITAKAAEPQSMSASGIITSISEADEFVAGNSARVKVFSRSIYGSFTNGDLTGDFAMTYKTNVDLYTQSGNFSGTLTSGSYVFKLNGKAQPVQLFPVPGMPGAYTGVSLSTGEWVLKTDESSGGVFTATVYFVPTPDGHMAYVLSGSAFDMKGVWTQ